MNEKTVEAYFKWKKDKKSGGGNGFFRMKGLCVFSTFEALKAVSELTDGTREFFLISSFPFLYDN